MASQPHNIEFKTQTYRYLKLNSILDALLLIILIPLPFSNFPYFIEMISNFWFESYRLYIVIYIGQLLTTVNSILTLIIVWNQYRYLQTFQITGKLFYFIFSVSIIFSILFHLPIIFLLQICVSLKTQIYKILAVNSYFLNVYTIFEFSFLFSIQTLVVFFNAIITFKVEKQKKSKLKSIIFTSKRKGFERKRFSSTSLSNERNLSLTSGSTSVKMLNYQISVAMKNVRKTSKFYETKTKFLTIYITRAYLIDQMLKTFCALLETLLIENSKNFNLFLILFLPFLMFTQLSHIFIYYKFNKNFSRRLKGIFSLLCFK